MIDVCFHFLMQFVIKDKTRTTIVVGSCNCQIHLNNALVREGQKIVKFSIQGLTHPNFFLKFFHLYHPLLPSCGAINCPQLPTATTATYHVGGGSDGQWLWVNVVGWSAVIGGNRQSGIKRQPCEQWSQTDLNILTDLQLLVTSLKF